MPLPLIGGGIERRCCLTSVCLTSDVCLSRTSSLSREQSRPRRTKIGTEVAHVTHDSDTTFKVKRSNKHRQDRLQYTALLSLARSVIKRWYYSAKVKDQGHQAALLTAALTRQAAVAVSVGTYSPWVPTATLPSAGAVGSAARGASAPTEGGGGILWRPPARPPTACSSVSSTG